MKTFPLISPLTSPLTRRSASQWLLGLGFVSAVVPLAPALADQDRYLDVRRGSEFNPISIAVTSFGGASFCFS